MVIKVALAQKNEELPFPKPEVEQAYRAIEGNTKEALEIAREAIMRSYSPFSSMCEKRRMEIARLLSSNGKIFDSASGVKYGIEERMEKGLAKKYEVFSVQVEFEGIKRRITSEVGPGTMAICLNSTGSGAKLLEMVEYSKKGGVEIFREGRQ